MEMGPASVKVVFLNIRCEVRNLTYLFSGEV